MMRFYVLLGLINVGCFFPLYLLHIRSTPNPFHHFVTTEKVRRTWPLRVLYMRNESPDPFRIHFDFTCFALVAAAMGATGGVARTLATVVLALGFIEIQYTTIMYSVFKRPPAVASDLSLLRAGVSLAKRQLYWMLPVAILALALVLIVSAGAVSSLFGAVPTVTWPGLVVIALLVPPGLYHAERSYSAYLWRTVYSPLLHLILNLRFCAVLERLYSRDREHYERFNRYTEVTLSGAPDVVVVCIESYGSIVYRDQRVGAGIPGLLATHEPDLARSGWRFASTFSEAPLFAGGSWLSYTTFLYGARIDEAYTYELLFGRQSSFGAYESLFHVLRRNGYQNVLLCPLGGVGPDEVDWESLDRCLQPQWKIDFDALGYVGPRINFLGAVQLYAALDQYALNLGYESARSRADRFSLFYCTLNSHYPWHSVARAAGDWRDLNTPTITVDVDARGSTVERYNASIRYQLDYILRFAADRTADAPLIILFGDHQPPMITPLEMGRQTPVHVLSQDPALIDAFLERGFCSTLDLTAKAPRPIRHESFLSLLMRGMQAAYGAKRDLSLPYLEQGAEVFADARLGSPIQT